VEGYLNKVLCYDIMLRLYCILWLCWTWIPHLPCRKFVNITYKTFLSNELLCWKTRKVQLTQRDIEYALCVRLRDTLLHNSSQWLGSESLASKTSTVTHLSIMSASDLSNIGETFVLGSPARSAWSRWKILPFLSDPSWPPVKGGKEKWFSMLLCLV
jgi:hypothetical protein